MSNIPFKKKLTARAIASACLVSGTGMALLGGGEVLAQEGEGRVIEEIIVSGIRGSLQRSMDVKRAGQGVVDAISAEDIGKMPDTNLAESLQRVTGVSIDRVNGEGSRVTVRGFGPDFNVITLNDRQMPAANVEFTTASASRSFDFAQLAAESVSSVEVYKTGRADLNTGGIGSVLNILTTRPLELPDGALSFGVKALNDTTNEEGGSDWTPEISGIYSDTFADGTFGVAITGSYAERDSGFAQGGTTSGWYTIPGGQGDWGSIAPDNPNFINAPQAGDIYSVPRNVIYTFGQVQRERTNAQLTLQWAPTETLTGTLDYTWSEFDVEQQSHELSAWFNGVPTAGRFTEGCGAGCVVAPVIYTDATGTDVGFGATDFGRINEMNSLGLNLEWTPTENLTLALDYHESYAENGGKDERGSHNVISGVQFNRAGATVDYSRDLPVLTLNLSEDFDPARMLSSGNSFRNSFMRSDIDQFQIKGEYAFDASVVRSIDFGVSMTEARNRSAFSNAQRDTWGGYGAAEDYPDSIFQRASLPGRFDDLSGSEHPNLQQFFYIADFEGLRSSIANIARANGEDLGPCDTRLCADPVFDTDRIVEEDQLAIYAQINFDWVDAALPTRLTIGARYEETDVDSRAFVPQYQGLVWSGDNEFTALSDGGGFSRGEGDYDQLLPNIDLDVEVAENVVLRASASKTITRPNFADLQGGQTINNPVRFNGGNGGSGNPDLQPFESTNQDYAAEWYYGEGSYFSVGYYSKDVENFIGVTTVDEPVFNLAHPAQGPRYDEAVAALGTSNATQVRAYLEERYGAPVAGDASLGDPATIFSLITPVNVEEGAIDGFEVALQHMFGESGYGVILNYTTVDGDVSYDNSNTNKGEGVENQFALLGLSDSTNLVGFYDRNGLQARIAYNWRDDFLAGTIDGNGERNPVYIEAYGQWDVNVSYEIREGLTVLAEGINITDETYRAYGRTKRMVINAAEQGARYALGLRYQF